MSTISRMDSVGSLNLKRKLDLDIDTPNKHSRSTSYQSSPPSSISPETTPEAGKEEVMVAVQGVLMPFSQVTEEHHDMMTPDEYIHFCDIVAAGAG